MYICYAFAAKPIWMNHGTDIGSTLEKDIG